MTITLRVKITIGESGRNNKVKKIRKKIMGERGRGKDSEKGRRGERRRRENENDAFKILSLNVPLSSQEHFTLVI